MFLPSGVNAGSQSADASSVRRLRLPSFRDSTHRSRLRLRFDAKMTELLSGENAGWRSMLLPRVSQIESVFGDARSGTDRRF